jgi:hypothetical protein
MLKHELLKSKAVRVAYEKLGPEYAAARSVIASRRARRS